MAEYKVIDEIEYLEGYGLTYFNNEFRISNKEKLSKAYEQAWQNRDFEINKFWTRAAYFWGFLVLIFGAYFTLIRDNELENQYHIFYIICIGIIFSTAWVFVIRGSKQWQENWESHIDMLENFVSGPLYKTIFKYKNFYSVSKINEILSHLIFVVWVGFLLEFLIKQHHLPWDQLASKDLDFRIIVGVAITIVFILNIWKGYGRSKFNLKGRVNRRNSWNE